LCIKWERTPGFREEERGRPRRAAKEGNLRLFKGKIVRRQKKKKIHDMEKESTENLHGCTTSRKKNEEPVG